MQLAIGMSRVRAVNFIVVPLECDRKPRLGNTSFNGTFDVGLGSVGEIIAQRPRMSPCGHRQPMGLQRYSFPSYNHATVTRLPNGHGRSKQQMSTQRLKAARKLAVEFVVIVAGVFVALAAESWWSDREHRAFERELREDMIVEFEANLRILDADIATNEEARQTIGFLEDLSNEILFSIPDNDLTDKLSSHLAWAGFDPEMGSAQAFVDSGNVGAIGDRELRLLMARWAGLLETRRRFNLQAVDFQIRELKPVIAHASADGRWSNNERRELRLLLGELYVLHGFVLDNQYELRVAAQEILRFLREGS